MNDVIVIGHVSNMKNQFASAPSGAVRGFDARTGALRWSFPVLRNVTDPGALAALGWDAQAVARTGGANVWSLMSVDEARDLVFLPTASAAPNFFGGTRPGDNRYANSVVALRGATGEVAWHFQTVHHDVWDYDVPAQPTLVDVIIEGKPVPAVVQVTKMGMTFGALR